VPALLGYVAARGRARIAADAATAFGHVASAAPGERDAAYAAARTKALRSMSVLVRKQIPYAVIAKAVRGAK